MQDAANHGDQSVVVLAPTATPAQDWDEWDGRLMLNVGTFIRREIAENPPPRDSTVANDLTDWAVALERCGDERLAISGARRLRLLTEARR